MSRVAVDCGPARLHRFNAGFGGDGRSTRRSVRVPPARSLTAPVPRSTPPRARQAIRNGCSGQRDLRALAREQIHGAEKGLAEPLIGHQRTAHHVEIPRGPDRSRRRNAGQHRRPAVPMKHELPGAVPEIRHEGRPGGLSGKHLDEIRARAVPRQPLRNARPKLVVAHAADDGRRPAQSRHRVDEDARRSARIRTTELGRTTQLHAHLGPHDLDQQFTHCPDINLSRHERLPWRVCAAPRTSRREVRLSRTHRNRHAIRGRCPMSRMPTTRRQPASPDSLTNRTRWSRSSANHRTSASWEGPLRTQAPPRTPPAHAELDPD